MCVCVCVCVHVRMGNFLLHGIVEPLLRDHPWGHVEGALSREVVSDGGDINMGHICTHL